jgi:hypothetical protein
MRSEFRLETSDFTNVQPTAAATVNIRNIRSSDYVYSTVLIVAQVTGTFSTVVYQIDSGTQRSMSRVGSTNRYQASWDTTTVSAGIHTLYVKAKSSSGTVVGSASVSVNVVTSYKWELYYEIDYMSGHTPPSSMLTYITNYWKGHAVKFNYQLDDVVTDPTPGLRRRSGPGTVIRNRNSNKIRFRGAKGDRADPEGGFVRHRIGLNALIPRGTKAPRGSGDPRRSREG